MKMFDGIRENQAVKLNNGKYLFCLYTGTYTIDNNRVSISRHNEQHLCEDITSITREVVVTGEISHYRFNDTDVSVDEVAKLSAAITIAQDKYYDEGSDDYYYPDIDTEFAIKKQQETLSRHVPVRLPNTIKHEPVVVTVIGSMEDTGSKFITTPFSIGKTTFSNGGVYRIAASEIAMDEFLKVKADFPSARFDLPTHSNLRFAQVNNTYLFNESDLGAEKDQVRVVSTLVEATNMEAAIRANVRDTITRKLLPVTITPDIITSYNVITELEAISRLVAKIDTKSRTVVEYNLAIKTVKKLIEKLKEIK